MNTHYHLSSFKSSYYPASSTPGDWVYCSSLKQSYCFILIRKH
ncbi:hypothetical protein HMPREF3197_01451 [Klebsiella pneumoniae]|nr:hypothetical protein HMPREF3197_01451 [Klebsiella pneumoniae]